MVCVGEFELSPPIGARPSKRLPAGASAYAENLRHNFDLDTPKLQPVDCMAGMPYILGKLALKC